MSTDILVDIIVKVEAAGYPVVAFVNDLGPTDLRLWKSLGVNIDSCSIVSPAVSDRRIFAFADVPYLVKLIGNNFLDYGFRLANGPNVESECVRVLIRNSVHDLKATHKSTQNHADVSGVKRMKASLAAQLLSETTAKSLQYFGNKYLVSKDYDHSSQIISLVDSWFDLFNYRFAYSNKWTKDCYGLHLEQQNKLLYDMLDTAISMKVCGMKHYMYPFQKGIILCSQSLLKLHEMLKQGYDFSYIR